MAKLLDEKIRSFIFVSHILKTFNVKAKRNQHFTRGCLVYLILYLWPRPIIEIKIRSIFEMKFQLYHKIRNFCFQTIFLPCRIRIASFIFQNFRIPTHREFIKDQWMSTLSVCFPASVPHITMSGKLIFV